ncbi:TonB-dependent receptor [Gluconacetobacter johannae DSM 13595]|nr:TonB-dependent receptor [Gluconacetobacter johannae DSM 13595]
MLCLATALFPVSMAIDAYAQDPQPRHAHHKSRHDQKKRPLQKVEHAGNAEVAAAPAPKAHGMQPHHSTAPENVEVFGMKRESPIGTIEQTRLVQKNAPNIMTVVSQEEIKKIPDFVLGDAARRMPGASVINKSGEARSIQIRGLDPNLNGVTYEGVLLPAGSINGSGRAVPLDAMPATLAGGLELIKTNQPQQDATALGGQLNVVSRDIGVDEKPFLEVIAAGGYRDPSMTQIFQGTLTGGMRFGLDSNPFSRHSSAEKPFSVTFFASALTDWLNMGDLQQKFANKAGLPANTVTTASQLMYAGHKVRYGYGGTLGWDIDRHNKVYLKVFDTVLDAPSVRNQLTYNFGSKGYVMDPAHPGVFTNTATSVQQAVLDGWTRNEERLYKFGGLSDAGPLTLDYYGAWASNFVYAPYAYNATFTNPTLQSVRYDNVTNPLRPTAVTTNGVNLTNYKPYTLSSLSNGRQNDMDSEWTGHIGAKTPLNFIPEVKGFLSFGGGARMAHIVHDDPQMTYGNLPAANAGDWAGNNSYRFFDGMYDIGNPVGTQHIRQLIDNRTYPITQNTAKDAITTQQSHIVDDENVYNLYLQYNATWRRLGAMIGFRYEKTDATYRGTQTATIGGQQILTPRAVGQEYANFFPTVQLRYNITDNLIARANYSTAIGRPGLNAVTATRTLNYTSNTITVGNPGLKPTTGTNFDVDMEYYLPKGGIISAGAFDKEFKNYVVNFTDYVANYPGMPAGVTTITTFTNIPYAFARGFELNYRQQFTFLPGFWKGFGIGGNMTFVQTRGRGRMGAVETLPNTASHIYNFEAFYNRGPVSIQFDGNYTGLTMTGLGTDPTLDSWVQPYLNFDIGARYAVTRNVTAYFQARNFTHTMQNATQGSSATRMVELQDFGSAYMFGVDAKF